jgi:hypothetical protein
MTSAELIKVHCAYAQEAHCLPVCSHPSANSISLQYRLAGADASIASAVATMHCSRMGSHMLIAGHATAADGGAVGIVHHASAAWRPTDHSASSTTNVPSTPAALPAGSDGSRPDKMSLDRMLHVRISAHFRSMHAGMATTVTMALPLLSEGWQCDASVRRMRAALSSR